MIKYNQDQKEDTVQVVLSVFFRAAGLLIVFGIIVFLVIVLGQIGVVYGPR